MIYKGKIEFEFESNLSIEELEESLQACLIETDRNDNVSKIILDNTSSQEFSIIDYLDTEVLELCEECNEPKQNRMIDVDGTNLYEALVCINYNNCSACR